MGVETLCALNSWAVLLLSWWCVESRFSEPRMACALALASVVPLARAARIEALRRRCTVPVEGVLAGCERCDVGSLLWTRDTWRYPWGDDARFVVDAIPAFTLWHRPIRGVGRTATLWVDPSRPPGALSAGALPPSWQRRLLAYRLTAALALLVVALTVVTCAGLVTW